MISDCARLPPGAGVSVNQVKEEHERPEQAWHPQKGEQDSGLCFSFVDGVHDKMILTLRVPAQLLLLNFSPLD
jgi:hypothetical protein